MVTSIGCYNPKHKNWTPFFPKSEEVLKSFEVCVFILQCQYASDQGFSPPHSPQMGTGGWMARTWGDKTWGGDNQRGLWSGALLKPPRCTGLAVFKLKRWGDAWRDGWMDGCREEERGGRREEVLVVRWGGVCITDCRMSEWIRRQIKDNNR